MKNLNVFIAFMLLIVLSFACEKENVEIQTDANQLELVQDRSNDGEVISKKGKIPRPPVPACLLGVPNVLCYNVGEPYTFTTAASPGNTIIWEVVPSTAGYIASGQGTISAQVVLNPDFSPATLKLRIKDGNSTICKTEYDINPPCVKDPVDPFCYDLFIDGPEQGCGELETSEIVSVGGVSGILATAWSVESGNLTIHPIPGSSTTAEVSFLSTFEGGTIKAEVITDSGKKCEKTLYIEACGPVEPDCDCADFELLITECEDDIAPNRIKYYFQVVGDVEDTDNVEWSAINGIVNGGHTTASAMFNTATDEFEEIFYSLTYSVIRECDGDTYTRTVVMTNNSATCGGEDFTTSECIID